MQTSPPYLSASRLRTYLSCPMKYRLQYIDQVPWEFTPAALVLGVATHAAVEAYYRSTRCGEALRADALIDVFDNSWSNETSTYLPLDTDDAARVREQGHGLIQLFLANARPGTVFSVEDSFRVPLASPSGDGELDVDLVGRLDLVEADANGSPVIVDLKTMARRPSEMDLRHDPQLLAYAYAARQTGIVSPDKDVLLRLDVLTKTKTPAFSQHFVVHPPESDRRFLSLASDVLHAIRAEAFPPSPGWACAGCPVAHACPFQTR